MTEVLKKRKSKVKPSAKKVISENNADVADVSEVSTLSKRKTTTDAMPIAPVKPEHFVQQGRVMVCSGGRYESQANAQVREAVMSGWEAIFGEGNVIATNIAGAAAAIEYIKPKIVFALGSYLPESTYFGEVCQRARDIGAVSIFWATEDPYEQDANYHITDDFDVIFSCDRWGTNFYNRPNVYHLPLAACEKLHYRPIDESIEKTIDILFCGVAFGSRKDLIRSMRPAFSDLNIKIVGPGWGEFGIGFSDSRIEKHQLIELYQYSKIVLNLGRSLHFENKRFMITPSTPGPRTFEAAIAGAMQVFHEDTYEIHEFYKPDEMPVFSTRRDFEQLLHKYLRNPELILETAKKAQARTLAEHTYRHRIQSVVKLITEKGLFK